MLAIQSSTKSNPDKCAIDILPCRVHHNGPAKVTKRHWHPTTSELDGSKMSYFRGRKLRGRTIKLPSGYKGVVMKRTDKTLPLTKKFVPIVEDDSDVEGQEEEPEEPVKVLKMMAEFVDVTVWGHDHLPDTDDAYIKGLEEWIGLAEAIHGDNQLNGAGKC